MKQLIFFGSDQYSAIVLETVLSSPLRSTIYDQVSIVTDRPKHVEKDLVITPSPVEKLAKTHNIKISYYPSNSEEMINFIDYLQSTIHDLPSTTSLFGLCASFDHLLPPNIIEVFGGNLYNLHPSLLPQYRNVSPVQYAIALGDTFTGITLFRITTGIDNGEIIGQTKEAILPTDTTLTLTPRLFKLGAELFLRFLGSDLKGSAQPADSKAGRSDPQGTPLIFTKRLTRDSGYIEWPVLQKLLANQPISAFDTKNELLSLRLTRTVLVGHPTRTVLEGILRALTPWPGAWSLVPTKKGDLRISLVSNSGSLIPQILISGKPNPISYFDFSKYYLAPRQFV